MKHLFNRFASRTAQWAGHPLAFLVSVLIVLVWAATGPMFHYNETWQLVINTGTTIVTFLMVFVIQNAQNRDGAAIQAKLDELIRATHAHNAFIGIEAQDSQEINRLRAQTREECEAQGTCPEN